MASPRIALDFRDRCCALRLLTASLEDVRDPHGEDRHPARGRHPQGVRGGWEILEKQFLPAERGFVLTARKRAQAASLDPSL